MANTIQHKRSTTASSVPSAGQLAVGELALNLTDKKIYSKDGSGNVVEMAPAVVADGSITTAKIADGNVTGAKLENSGVTAGSYTATNITVDAKGRITSASSGTSGGVTSLNGQTGAITNTDYGAIGSYVTAWSTSYAAQNQGWGPNVTQAGSTLARSVDYSSYDGPISMNAAGDWMAVPTGAYTSLGLSGTWRAMTYQVNSAGGASGLSGVALWVRIS